MMGPVSVDKAWLYEKYRLPYAHEAVGELLQRIGDAPVVADISIYYSLDFIHFTWRNR
jgi:hypothetical protein